MDEIICKGRGFNCNLDCKQKDNCDQYIDNNIDFGSLVTISLIDDISHMAESEVKLEKECEKND